MLKSNWKLNAKNIAYGMTKPEDQGESDVET